jgi:hypothetical protein
MHILVTRGRGLKAVAALIALVIVSRIGAAYDLSFGETAS